MTNKINYPAIKKALWEAWRVFIPAFIAIIYAQFEAGVDLKEWKSWVPALLIASCVAGLKAVFKWARAKYFAEEYDTFIYKLPF